MIVEYHRPQTIHEALTLLSRQEIQTLPLAGGSSLNRPSPVPLAVVDLQALGLNTWQARGSQWVLGAMFTLEAFLAIPDLPLNLSKAIHHEATYNLRQVATIAGTLVSSDGRSPFTALMLAMDAHLNLLPGEEQLALGDLLPVRSERLRGRLITQVRIPNNLELAYEYVARTPADLPIVCAALAQWPSGRTRLTLGGYGQSPVLVLDGPGADGVEAAARNAYLLAGDQWAGAEYRSDVAGILAKRCLENLKLKISNHGTH